MRLLLIFFLLIVKIFPSQESTINSDPDFTVGGCVNAITGEYFAVETDLLVKCAQPFPINRVYSTETGWNFFPHIELEEIQKVAKINEDGKTVQKKRQRKLQFRDEFGTPICLRPTKHNGTSTYMLDYKNHHPTIVNTHKGIISGQTNLKNIKANYNEEHGVYRIYFGDGTKRYYGTNPNDNRKFRNKQLPNKRIAKYRTYLLFKEKLPNGNEIHYSYDKKSRLIKILIGCKNKEKKEYVEYGWVEISYTEKNRKYITSDHQEITYHLDGEKLTKITSTNSPEEIIIETPHQLTRRLTETGPYTKANFSLGKVESLFSIASSKPLYSFAYQKRAGATAAHTKVTDCLGNTTTYYWKSKGRPDKIIQPDKSAIQYIYGNRGKNHGDLLAILTLAPDGKCKKAISYSYDSNHNITTKTLWGNLSGQDKEPIQLDKNMIPVAGPSVSTYYTYNGRNLPILIKEPTERTTQITYHLKTNLPTSKLIYNRDKLQVREYYEYDLHNNLKTKTADDGTSEIFSNLENVTTRTITHYHLVQQGPALHLPEIIEESYWDPQTNTEKTLKKTHLEYDSNCRIKSKSIYDKDKNHCYTHYYQYDDHGNIVEENNPNGEITKYTYDHLDQCTKKIENAKGLITTYTYDPSGNLIEETQHGSNSKHHHYTFNPLGQKTTSTDPFGLKTTYTYDNRGNLTKTSNSIATTQTTYDFLGNPTTTIDSRGKQTKRTYNICGQVTKIIYPDNTTETFTYSPSGNLIEKVDQSSRRIQTTYDFQGRPLKKELLSQNNELLSQETNTYSAFHLLSHTDQGGRLTTYTYDAAGRKIKETFIDQETTYTYDPLSRIAEKSQKEQLTRYTYDNQNQILTESAHDLRENTLISQTTYTYDAHGNPKTITNGPSTEEFEYNAFNRLTTYTNPLGYQTTTDYEGLTKTTTDPEGRKTVQTYNSYQHLLSSAVYSPTETLIHEENFQRDPSGNLLRHIITIYDSNGPLRTTEIAYSYDEMGRLTSHTEADQKTTQYTYTVDGQEKTITKPDGTIIEKIYDDKGRHTSTKSNNIYYTFTYDQHDRCIESTDHIEKTKTKRTYDPYDNLTSEKFANGLTLTSTYTQNSQRKTLTLPDNRTVHYQYTPYHLKTVSFNGYTHTYDQYDHNFNPIEETFIANLGSQKHTYDRLNRERTRKNPYQTETHKTFDKVGNLTARTLNQKTYRYHYNDLNQLLSENDDTYSYDSLHNRLSKNDDDYTITTLNQIATTNESEFSYDLNGNPTNKKTPNQNITYKYDALDRLIQIKTPQTKTTYTYDPWHRRISKQNHYKQNGQWIANTPQHFIYDQENEIGQVENNTITQLRILGLGHGAEIGASILIELNNQTYLPLHTISGDISALINTKTNQPIETYTYNAFGEEQTTSTQNPWRFQSKRTDDTALVFFGRRYYSPQLGRFITPDPKGYSEGPNLYAYLNNNPLTQFDLYGLSIDRGGVIVPPGGKSFSPPTGKAVNIAAGVAHGAIDFSIDLAKFPCVITNLIYSSPGMVYNLCLGEDPFQDFSSRNQNIDACFDQATDIAFSFIPADTSSPYYQYSRTGTKLVGDAALLAVGVGAAYKGYQATRVGLALGSEVYTGAQTGKTFLKRSSSKLRIPQKTCAIKNSSWVLPKEGGGAFNGTRWYTEHALERMAPKTPQVMAELESRFIGRAKIASQKLNPQRFNEWCIKNTPKPRGIPPSVVEAEILQPGSTGVSVVLNENGHVITVIPGGS